MTLPPVHTDGDVDELRKDGSTCAKALRAVADSARLPAGEIEFFADGSNLVGGLGDHVIKMFAPFDGGYRTTEQRALEFLQGRLPVATPELRHQGEWEGWTYLVMSRLSGQPLSVVWRDLSPEDRFRLCFEIGQCAACLHGLDPTPVDDPAPSWQDYLSSQRVGALEQQKRSDPGREWTSQIEDFLDSVELPRAESVFLHTELAREHFFVAQRDGRWELTGLLDFEPAMLGHPEYDFASVGLFVTRGDKDLFGAVLDGYGAADATDREVLSRRFLAYTLLHRYSCLRWYLTFMPTEGLSTLDDIARAWW